MPSPGGGVALSPTPSTVAKGQGKGKGNGNGSKGNAGTAELQHMHVPTRHLERMVIQMVACEAVQGLPKTGIDISKTAQHAHHKQLLLPAYEKLCTEKRDNGFSVIPEGANDDAIRERLEGMAGASVYRTFSLVKSDLRKATVLWKAIDDLWDERSNNWKSGKLLPDVKNSILKTLYDESHGDQNIAGKRVAVRPFDKKNWNHYPLWWLAFDRYWYKFGVSPEFWCQKPSAAQLNGGKGDACSCCRRKRDRQRKMEEKEHQKKAALESYWGVKIAARDDSAMHRQDVVQQGGAPHGAAAGAAPSEARRPLHWAGFVITGAATSLPSAVQADDPGHSKSGGSAAGAGGHALSEPPPSRRWLEEWSVGEISGLLDKCGFASAAAAAREGGVDGGTFQMLDQDTLSAPPPDGLGLSRLQTARVMKELRAAGAQC